MLLAARCHAAATCRVARASSSTNPPYKKLMWQIKSPVGDISVVTLIRTDTTLDHSQKAEKVCISVIPMFCNDHKECFSCIFENQWLRHWESEHPKRCFFFRVLFTILVSASTRSKKDLHDVCYFCALFFPNCWGKLASYPSHEKFCYGWLHRRLLRRYRPQSAVNCSTLRERAAGSSPSASQVSLQM